MISSQHRDWDGLFSPITSLKYPAMIAKILLKELLLLSRAFAIPFLANSLLEVLRIDPFGIRNIKRRKQVRSLTVKEFQHLSSHLEEPFKTMALVQVYLGLRVSELCALRWKDVDWICSRLNVEHGIVKQWLDTVKTEESRKSMTMDARLLSTFSAWRQRSEFQDAEDWIFPSPAKLGRLLYFYTGYWRGLQDAAAAAGLGKLGTPASATPIVRGSTPWVRRSPCSRS